MSSGIVSPCWSNPASAASSVSRPSKNARNLRFFPSWSSRTRALFIPSGAVMSPEDIRSFINFSSFSVSPHSNVATRTHMVRPPSSMPPDSEPISLNLQAHSPRSRLQRKDHLVLAEANCCSSFAKCGSNGLIGRKVQRRHRAPCAQCCYELSNAGAIAPGLDQTGAVTVLAEDSRGSVDRDGTWSRSAAGKIGDRLVGTLPRLGAFAIRGDELQCVAEIGLACVRVRGCDGEREHLELARPREADLLVE